MDQAESPAWGVLGLASRALGRARWLFLPLGLAACVAIGVHAAADALADVLLWRLASLSAWLGDALVELHLASAEALDAGVPTNAARGLALAWELSADVALALPLFVPLDGGPVARTRLIWRAARAVMVVWFVVCASCALAEIGRAEVFAALMHETPDASRLAQLAAWLVLAIVGPTLGLRAVIHAFERPVAARAGGLELVWACVVLPLFAASLAEMNALVGAFR